MSQMIAKGIITAEQLRGARSMLRWDQKDLAEKAGVSLPTLKRLEGGSGPLKATYENVARLVATLEAAGVVFVSEGEASENGGQGIRLTGATQV